MLAQIRKEDLEKIGSYILEGLSEDEACILTDIDPSDFRELKERDPASRMYIEKKIVDFKHIHLKEIQKVKNEKNSQWLLEKLRPEEFGSKAQNKNPTTVNIISQIIKTIQNDGEATIIPKNRQDLIELGENEKDRALEVESVLK